LTWEMPALESLNVGGGRWMTDMTIERVVVPVFKQLRVLKLQETEVTLAPLLALLPPLPPQTPPQPPPSSPSSLPSPVDTGTAFHEWQKQKKLDADAAAAAAAESKAGVVPDSESPLASEGSAGSLSLESLDLSWCDHVSRSTAVSRRVYCHYIQCAEGATCMCTH
jgi:hypothetical protein